MSKWAQNADTSGVSIKSSRYLDIPENQRIPKTLLNAIVSAPVGSTISNPTQTGKQRITVTRKLKQKANFVRNVNYR